MERIIDLLEISLRQGRDHPPSCTDIEYWAFGHLHDQGGTQDLRQLIPDLYRLPAQGAAIELVRPAPVFESPISVMSHVVERLLLRERLPGQNFEAANRLLHGFEAARRFHGVGAKVLDGKSGIVGWSVDRYHGAEFLAVSGSIDQHVMRAHRMADEHGGAQSPMVDNL